MTNRKSIKAMLTRPAKEKGPFQTPSDSSFRSCAEFDHEDNEEISRTTFPWLEIFPTLAGHSSQARAHLKNAATGAVFSNSHHVKGQGAKKWKDFEAFECCFCLEWLLVQIPANGPWYWVRCGNMFNRKSQQCIVHPKVQYKDGPNKIYGVLADNEIGNWGMLKNINVDNERVSSGPTQDHAELLAKSKELAEVMAKMLLEGEETNELEAELVNLEQAMSKLPKERSPAAQQPSKSKAVPVASLAEARANATENIYGRRRKASSTSAGDAVLDRKSKQNPNQKIKSHIAFSMMPTVGEEPAREPKKTRGKP